VILLPFESKNQFFYLLYNEPDVFMEWVEKYGVPAEFKVGSTKHWLRKINQMEPNRNRRSAESFEAYNPPQVAVNNAKRGLRLREKWNRGGMSPAEARKAGIDSGVTRAKKISSGSVSKHDVRRMSAFNRHRKNYAPSKKKPDGGPTAGTIAWLLWGGTSGVDWAKKKSAAMNAEDYNREGTFKAEGGLLGDTELTKKEIKTIMWYPLVIGFLGGTLATVAGNILSALYLKRKHGLWADKE